MILQVLRESYTKGVGAKVRAPDTVFHVQHIKKHVLIGAWLELRHHGVLNDIGVPLCLIASVGIKRIPYTPLNHQTGAIEGHRSQGFDILIDLRPHPNLVHAI
mgnify:CR=1 FL=1